MKARLHTKRSKVVAAGTAGLMVLGAGAAYAYWSSLGGGTTDGNNATGSTTMTVTSNKVDGLTPGGSIKLSGYVGNPGDTDAMAGSVLGTVTAVGGDAGSIADYWISGTAKLDANVPHGTSVAWSGLTLHYANSANNQNSGKGAGISISYTLTDPGTIIGEGTITNGDEVGSCYTTTPGNDGPVWAHSTFDKQFQLVKNADGYAYKVVYGNGTFVGVDGATTPAACGSGAGEASPVGDGSKMGVGITGTLAGSWSGQIFTTLVGNPDPNCDNNKCINSAGFLTAVFGTVTDPNGTKLQPPMSGYSWNVVYNAGPSHGTVTQIGTAGVLSGSGNIK